MNRLISEQYLIEHIKACFENGRPMYRPTLDEVLEMIKAIPSAEPKTGHWIEIRCDMYECSECDYVYTDLSGERYGMHYCPNCGARMIEPQESEDKG